MRTGDHDEDSVLALDSSEEAEGVDSEGWCWINDRRACNAMCMAYSVAEVGQTPCSVLRASERVPDALLLGQDESVRVAVSVMDAVRNNTEALREQTMVLNNILMRLQSQVRF